MRVYMREEAMLTEFERAAIRARCEAATPGKWVPKKDPADPFGGNRLAVDTPDGFFLVCTRASKPNFTGLNADASFVAHSRSDLPRTLDDIEALRALVRELMLATPYMHPVLGDLRSLIARAEEALR